MLEDRLARANMASAVVDEIAVDASEALPDGGALHCLTWSDH